MQHDLRKDLIDIYLHIKYIDDFLGSSRDFVKYEASLTIQYAVERALEIIGEAVNQIRKIKPDIVISSIHQIVALRNILTHSYESVNSTVVWSILIDHLPVLKLEVADLSKRLQQMIESEISSQKSGCVGLHFSYIFVKRTQL